MRRSMSVMSVMEKLCWDITWVYDISQVMVQKEQLAEELSNMKKRFDTYILDTQARLLEERESVRRESQMMIDTINQKVCH